MEPRRPSGRSVGASLRAVAKEVEESSGGGEALQGLKAAAQEVHSDNKSDKEDEDYEDAEFEDEEDGGKQEKNTKTELMKAVAQVDEEQRPVQPSLQETAETLHSHADEPHENSEPEDSSEESATEEEPEDDGLEELDERSAKTLMRYAFHNRLRQAEELLEEKRRELGVDRVSVNCTDKHGWTPLIWAASRGHVDFCEMLIRHGALVNKQETTNGWTALHLAAINVKPQVVELLLNHNASRKKLDFWGDIPHEVTPRPLKNSSGNKPRYVRKLLRPVFKSKTTSRKPSGGDSTMHDNRIEE